MGEEIHVIREIPVFLSKCLSEKLCLIQYPQRPATVSMESHDVLQAKIKPQQTKLQLTLGIDTEAETYDEEAGELFAEAAEGIGLDEDKYMPDRRLTIDKTTFESTTIPKLTNPSRYVIGIIRGGQLTLTPLKSIVQMKPVFPYLNKADKARAAYQKEQQGGDTEDEGEEAEATKVTVKFSRNTAGDSKGPTRASSYSARKKEEEEPWIDLTYVHNDSSEYEKLYSTNMECETPFYVLTKQDYLQMLFPKHAETCITGPTDKKHANPRISIQQMRLMAVPEQLKVLLLNAKLIQYHQVVDFLKVKLRSEIDEASLLRYIQTVAIMVQGCWVVRSEVIYPDDYKSGTHGIPGPIMQRARDMILNQFIEHRFVERRKMLGMTRLPSEEVTEMLTHVSKIIPKKGWEFMLPYDADFVSRFPEVVQRQTLIWEMKNQQRNRKNSTTDSKDKTSSGSPPRRRSRNKSFSSDDSGAESETSNRGRRGSESGRQRRNSTRSSEVGIPSKVET